METDAQVAAFRLEHRPDPCVFVMFGATGDLARRKLVPGLYHLFAHKQLPEGFALVGIGRSVPDVETFRALHLDAMHKLVKKPPDPHVWEEFASRIHYVRGDHDDSGTYQRLAAALEECDQRHGTEKNRLYHLAVPPSAFAVVLAHLRAARLIYPAAMQPPWSRVMIEKPFGRDLASARELNRMCAEFLDESQIFRIDHYLGKETVQNILVFRFGNAIWEPIWNRKYIDHVQITASEELGMEGRGKFYDETGALRDVVQNHLLEVLALVAMEPPVSFRADDQRDERVQVFRSLRILSGRDVDENTVRAQFRGFHAEPDIAPESRTPTFAALKVNIDNWRWQGVPFYLRAGKKLKKRLTEVAIHFQTVPMCLFGRDEVCQRLDANVLVLRIQPDEGISLNFICKAPGKDLHVEKVAMDFTYAESFSAKPQEAYERLFIDGMRGDASLFARRDGVEKAWEFISPIMERWDEQREDALPVYEAGSDGPDEATELLANDKRQWRQLA